MKRVLITGISGFVGSYLAEFLLAKDYNVSGTVRDLTAIRNIKHIKSELQLHVCDVRNQDHLHSVVASSKPDQIYHLAAIAHVPTSWKNPWLTYETNFFGTLNLLETLRSTERVAKILYVGSSDEYGSVGEESLPINEEVSLSPLNPYAVSKVCGDMLAFQYFKSYGLHIVRVRPFNHTGPRQTPAYVCSGFAKQVAEIERGVKDPVVTVGNLEAKRDFTDVRDMVRAYWLAMEEADVGEVYNICSEKAIGIGDILTKLLEMSSRKDIIVQTDVTKVRPSDVPLIVGDCSKFRAKTGWATEIPIEQTLRDLLEYWRKAG